MKDGEGRIFLSFSPTLQSTDPPRWNPFYGSGTSRPLPGQHHPAASDCIVHTVDLLDTSLRITSPQDGSVQPTFVTVEGTCVGNRYVDLAVDGAENQRRPCFDGQTGHCSSVAIGLMATNAAGNYSDYTRVTYEARPR